LFFHTNFSSTPKLISITWKSTWKALPYEVPIYVYVNPFLIFGPNLMIFMSVSSTGRDASLGISHIDGTLPHGKIAWKNHSCYYGFLLGQPLRHFWPDLNDLRLYLFYSNRRFFWYMTLGWNSATWKDSLEKPLQVL